jgi:hypothetical protein
MALVMILSISTLLLALVTTATFVATGHLPFEAPPASHLPLSKSSVMTQSES